MTHFIIYRVIRIRSYGQSVTVADLHRCLASACDTPQALLLSPSDHLSY